MSERDPPGLDVTWPQDHAPASESGTAPPAAERKWVGIHFECCDVYARIYRRPEEAEYLGACPRCGRSIRIRVGPGGVAARLFRARVV